MWTSFYLALGFLLLKQVSRFGKDGKTGAIYSRYSTQKRLYVLDMFGWSTIISIFSVDRRDKILWGASLSIV
jgi:hypothetical protein